MDGKTRARGIAAKLALMSASAVVSINLWTGFPLLALWVGSKVQGGFSSPKIEAVASVVAVLAILVLAGASVLAWLNDRYDELTDRPPEPRRRYPWLESMRGDRRVEVRRARGVSGVERVVVVSVVAAVLIFEAWFFFLAGSPLAGA